jgi:hypothetical protein
MVRNGRSSLFLLHSPLGRTPFFHADIECEWCTAIWSRQHTSLCTVGPERRYCRLYGEQDGHFSSRHTAPDSLAQGREASIHGCIANGLVQNGCTWGEMGVPVHAFPCKCNSFNCTTVAKPAGFTNTVC